MCDDRPTSRHREQRLILSCLALLLAMSLLAAGCSHGTQIQQTPSAANTNLGRFERAQQLEQFVVVDRTADCKGTKVTIEKVLFDKTHTFMIAAVDGPIRGRMDSMNVDLFDDAGRELGRSSFLHTLADGKTLLTFDPVSEIPKGLRLEFFGGPVGYGDGHVVLTLDGAAFKRVDSRYTKEYRLVESHERPGYRLELDTVAIGISETYLHYQLRATGDYDAIRHGWAYDWHNNHSPEGDIIVLSDSGRPLALHLSSSNCLGPYYRVSQDRKAMAGRAYFDAALSDRLELSLTHLYGEYSLNEIVPIDGVKDRLDINSQLVSHGLTIELKSFTKVDNETWALDYRVLDEGGNEVRAVLDAGIYMKDDNYRMPLSSFQMAAPDRQNRLVISWQQPDPSSSMVKNPAIKVHSVGIPLDSVSLTIDLAHPKLAVGLQERDRVLAAVEAYHQAIGQALADGDLAILEREYGHLQPTGERWEGINDWRQEYGRWISQSVTDYTATFEEPIIILSSDGSSAVVDLYGIERFPHNGIVSAGGFSAVYSLGKRDGTWTIVKVDRATEEEYYRQWR